MKNLSEYSSSYRENAHIYKLFSDAEDAPGHVGHYLCEHLHGSLLDVGCGNGKYSYLSDNYLGIDKAGGQLRQAKINYPHKNFIQADCLHLPFAEKIFDNAIACWMLGTLDASKQTLALSQIEACTKNKIFLVENDIDSEFEVIRGRHLDKRTSDYNHSLLSHGFRVVSHIDTYFQFSDKETANRCFRSIWGDSIRYDISARISHRIVIFEKNLV